MMISSCDIFTGSFSNIKRINKSDDIIQKEGNSLELVYLKNDTLEDFELKLNSLCGNSSSFFSLKKKFSTMLFSIVSVFVILFALISSSLYEDLLKKIIFETPFSWNINDSISMLFVLLFLFGLVMMPSILEGESSQFKDVLKSWFNKDVRVLKRVKITLKDLDKKYEINIYNADIQDEKHWLWRLIIPAMLNHFININFYVRNDRKKVITKRLKSLGVINPIYKIQDINKSSKNIDLLLSNKELVLYKLMQLSSTNIINNSLNEKYVSLELFEYCGRNFFEDKDNTGSIISGFQNFINRSFDDFSFLQQSHANQMFFTKSVKFRDLEDEKRRLSYYLRNHIEECISYFDNPISLLILYYYVKDIVLDEKRMIAILEKLIITIKNKQQYDLIDTFWFDIASKMFNPSDLSNFETTNNSIYRKLSVQSLDNLMFLFERSGHFKQALKIAEYLYEINPSKYSIGICSLYERMGEFDKAYTSLENEFKEKKSLVPSDIEIRYHQRKAWIIVSQRREDDKQNGLDAIAFLEKLLFSHKENNQPLWLWHYYNIKANYNEWNKDYKEAIKNYEKCLSIPSLGAFEYGGTFVNMAISYRYMYLTDSTHNFTNIDTSIKLAKLGTLLKESVGDRDEMPVVLHNQALNMLYKILYFKIDKKVCKDVLEITNYAISILDETESRKRLGMLLVENYISKILLQKPFENVLLRLKKQMAIVDENEKEQILKLHKEFVSFHKLTSIDFLE